MRNDGEGGTDRGAGEICVWFCEEKQEFNRHEESSFFSGASGGRRSASAAVDGATAIPHLNEDTFLSRRFGSFMGAVTREDRNLSVGSWGQGSQDGGE